MWKLGDKQILPPHNIDLNILDVIITSQLSLASVGPRLHLHTLHSPTSSRCRGKEGEQGQSWTFLHEWLQPINQTQQKKG